MPSLFKTPTLQKLKPYYLLFVLLLATHACKKNSEEKSSSASLPEKESFTVIRGGNVVGHLKVDRTGDTVAIDYDYKDNGRGPTIKETLVVDAAGYPV